jgi:hypothetical protein
MNDFESSLREGLATLAREAVPDIDVESSGLADLTWERASRRPAVMRGLLAAAAIAVVVGAVGLLIAHQSTNHGPPVAVSTTAVPTTAVSQRTVPTTLEPPDAQSTAAGACDTTTGDVVTITSGSLDNVPNPRCAIVHDNQRVRVVNTGTVTENVSLGEHFRATVPGHSVKTFADPVGAYLAPGVHYLKLSALSSADIWVKP